MQETYMIHVCIQFYAISIAFGPQTYSTCALNLTSHGCILGPALMAVWSKALPLTASCLLPLPGFECQARASEKVTSDLG